MATQRYGSQKNALTMIVGMLHDGVKNEGRKMTEHDVVKGTKDT